MNSPTEVKNSFIKHQIYQELLRIFNLEQGYGDERDKFLKIFPVRLPEKEEYRLIGCMRVYVKSWKQKRNPATVSDLMDYNLIDTDDEQNQAAFKAWKAPKHKRLHNDDDNDDADIEAQTSTTSQPRQKQRRSTVSKFPDTSDTDNQQNQAAFQAWKAPQNKHLRSDDNDEVGFYIVEEKSTSSQPRQEQSRVSESKLPETIAGLVEQLQQTNRQITDAARAPSWATARTLLQHIGIFRDRQKTVETTITELTNSAAVADAKAASFDEQTARLTAALNPARELG